MRSVSTSFFTFGRTMKIRACIFPLFFLIVSCQVSNQEALDNNKVRLITLDPGHFHAALVQKFMYPSVDSIVHVYAPQGPDVELHMKRIETFNHREKDPTRWHSNVYTGSDFLERMISEIPGNVVVISGNNQKKTEYIERSLNAGLHVLADKPMAISASDFSTLKRSFRMAEERGLLLYDIMTERFEITTMLQRELSRMPEIFGTLQKGSIADPAVTKESVHHFYKYVAGNVLTRPPWFMDPQQQGDGLVDVTTHLVDLIQWECFPEQVIDTTEIEILGARRWPTVMTQSQFTAITKVDGFPDYLDRYAQDTVLSVYSNGAIDYTIRGIHARVSVKWDYRAPEGGGDTHFSAMRGTLSNLIIRQGKEQNYKPALYIEPIENSAAFASVMKNQFASLQQSFPGIDLKKTDAGWEVVIPEKYREGHEEHFTRVMENFLAYLQRKNMPSWEVPNMIAKYYTTTQALKLAQNQPGQP